MIDEEAQESSERALRMLMKEHGRAVESFIARRERDPAVREEIWSDVFRLAHGHLDELTDADSAGTRRWLWRVAELVTSNAGRRATTRRRLIARLEIEPVLLQSSPEDEYIAQEDRQSEHIEATLSALNVEQRRILLLDALGDAGPAIAATLGISHQAARSRLMRARTAFVRAYNAVASDDESQPQT